MRRFFYFVLLYCIAADMLLSCSSGNGMVCQREKYIMPKDSFCKFLDIVESYAHTVIWYDMRDYEKHPLTSEEANGYVSRFLWEWMEENRRLNYGERLSVKIGRTTQSVKYSDRFDRETKWRSDSAWWVTPVNSTQLINRVFLNKRKNFYIKGSWHKDSYYNTEKYEVDSVAVTSGKDNERADRAELISHKFTLMSNPPFKYELSGTFRYKNNVYDFRVSDNYRHDVCVRRKDASVPAVLPRVRHTTDAKVFHRIPY